MTLSDPLGEIKRSLRAGKLEYWAKRKEAKPESRKVVVIRCSLCLATIGTFQKDENGQLIHVDCPNHVPQEGNT